MSGGHFNYNQHHLREIADEILEIIDNENELLIAGHESHYSPKTLAKFSKAERLLRKAEIYVQRIDWLLSGDDGEDNFHERLRADLDELEVSE